jgi:hypothetical protein
MKEKKETAGTSVLLSKKNERKKPVTELCLQVGTNQKPAWPKATYKQKQN